GRLFQSNVLTATADDPVRKAAAAMQDNDVGAVVIVKGRQVAGMVTDRDLALALGLGKATPDTPLRDVMTRRVDTVWDDDGVFNATQHMLARKVRRLPIVNHDRELVGIVTFDDLLALFSRELYNISKA